MKKKLLWIAPLALVGFAAFIALGGWIVSLLWNWLVPDLFGWSEITFWQALGLLALCRILFGGCGMRGSVRNRVHERVEERVGERVRDRMRERWGFGSSTGEQ